MTGVHGGQKIRVNDFKVLAADIQEGLTRAVRSGVSTLDPISAQEGTVAHSGDLITWVTLAAIFGGAAALYGWLFWSKTRALWRAMVRLRDRIDRSRRW